MSDRQNGSFGTGGTGTPSTRRHFLALGGTVGAASLAGCGGFFGGGGATAECRTKGGDIDISAFRGSGPLVEERSEPGGTSIADLPDLSGTLKVYIGGGEGGVWLELFRLFQCIYDDLTIKTTTQDPDPQMQAVVQEHKNDNVNADVYLSVEASTLGGIAEEGAATTLSDEILSEVPSAYQDGEGRWVGFAGRARAIPYNTETLSSSDIPNSVQAFPETSAFANAIGWAPSYGAFQSFVTAMRHIQGEDATRTWLNEMQSHGTSAYSSEFQVSNKVADGDVAVGLANHYYAQRVQNQRSDAPIELAFTEGDAGALVNVSGALLVDGTDDEQLGTDFVRHLLSTEAQEFLATRSFAYPMISEVEPVGGLPTIDELNPPEVDLTALSDITTTVQMLRDENIL